MTKRIVSGIFILTALGALGVILAGALTSGEQLIVRFLTAVIVAALGLYVISDLRLQADDDAITARSGGGTRIDTVDVPPNSTAAFMATVTKRGDKDDKDDNEAGEAAASADDKPDKSREKVAVGAAGSTNGNGSTNGKAAAGSATNGSENTNGSNGHASNGHASNGHTEDGHTNNTASENGQADKHGEADKHAVTGNGTDRETVKAGAAASSTTEAASADVEAAGSGVRNSLHAVSTKAPATVRSVGISPPKDVTLVDILPNQMNGSVNNDEAGQVDAAAAVDPTIGGHHVSSTPPDNHGASAATGGDGPDRNSETSSASTDDQTPAGPSSPLPVNGNGSDGDSSEHDAQHQEGQSDSDVTAEMKHTTIFAQMGSDSIPSTTEPEATAESDSTTKSEAATEFEYSDELQSTDHEWPKPPSKPIEPAAEQPHPFEKASAAYQAEKERLAAQAQQSNTAQQANAAGQPDDQPDSDQKQASDQGSDSHSALPVPAGSQDLEAAEYADAPLAPIIDLREVNNQAPGTIDAAINAGEVEVIATLIEQGMLSTDGPISDRDVRTMVYVAFTSNELRKLLLAGGSPDGPNYGLDLGPVELFDEKVHAPAPKTLYSGIPRRQPQPQSQIG